MSIHYMTLSEILTEEGKKEVLKVSVLDGLGTGKEIRDALDKVYNFDAYPNTKKIKNFLNSLSDVELYRYRKLLLETFYTSKFTPSPTNAGTQEFIAKRIGEGPSNVNNIEVLFKSFLSRSGFPNIDFLSKGGSPDINFRDLLLSIGGSSKSQLNISPSDAKSILYSFIALLISEGGLAELNFQGSSSFESLFDDLHKKFKLTTQSNGHRHRAERLKKMGPMLKVIKSDPKLHAIFKKSSTDQYADTYKKKDPLYDDDYLYALESRLSVNDEKTYKQLTAFFVKLGSDTGLMRLFYESAMIIARRESDIRRKKLKKANEKGPIKLEGLRIGLGITGGIYSEVESMLYPNKSKGVLTVGKEDYFGGSFNLGGYLTEAFRVNSRNRAEIASDIPWPTYDGSINFAGPLSIFDETHISADDYSRDYIRGFEIGVKHLLHSNHLFNCDVVSQEQTKNGTLSMLCDTRTNEVVRVLDDDIVRTAGTGEHKVGCKNMSEESFQIIKDSEEKFDPDLIYQDVVNWMASPAFKNKTTYTEKIPFKTKFPNTPIRLTSQQLIILSKMPGFPFETFVEGHNIAWIGDGDTTKIGLERVYLNKAKGTKSAGYTEPTSFVVGRYIDYKQKFKRGQRARYGGIANYIADEEGKTTNFRIVPLKGLVMDFDASGTFEFGGVKSGSMVVDLKSDFKISAQLMSKLSYTLNGDSTAVFNYDLIIDCSGYYGSALGNIIKTQEVDLTRNNLISLPFEQRGSTSPVYIRDSLNLNIAEKPQYTSRFIMRNDSWFEVKFSDKHRVVIGSYNEKRKMYKEFLFFREDFEKIFGVATIFDEDLSYADIEKLLDKRINLDGADEEMYNLIDSLGYDSKLAPELILDYVKETKTYINILDPQSGLVYGQKYIQGESPVNDSLIKSVFGRESKDNIVLYNLVGSEPGIRFLGPMGKVLTPEFSDFEDKLLNKKLGIGENVVARFRTRWRVYGELYRRFDKRVEDDERCAVEGVKGFDEITVTDEGKFYRSFDILVNQRVSFNRTQEEQNLVYKKYGDKNYIDRNLYFWSWVGDMINESGMSASDLKLKNNERVLLEIPLSMVKTRVKADGENNFTNSYEFTLGKIGDVYPYFDNYFQAVFNINQSSQKNIRDYISYVVGEYGISTIKEKKELVLKMPLKVVYGKVVLDTGGLDMVDYELRMDEAYKRAGEKAVVREARGEGFFSSVDSTTASGIADTLGAASKPLKYQRAQFGFYDPDGCELKI